jgi:hypothetical protein
VNISTDHPDGLESRKGCNGALVLSMTTAAWRGPIVSLAMFTLLLSAFAASSVTNSADSRWSIHTAMSFARGHGGDLTEYLPALEKNDFYSIEYPDGKPRTHFPIGISLLAMPFVVVASWFDPSLERTLRTEVPARFEQFIASIFGAIAGCIFFWLIFYQFESVLIALFSTVIFCFGTSMWSTATRGLWQHGPMVMMLVIAMLLLARVRKSPQLIQFVSLPLAMAYLIRPSAVVPIFAISGYVLLWHGKWFVRYVAWAMLIAVPWLLYNFSIYHAPVPPYYYQSAFATTNYADSLLGNLFSPSRGLFVFSPVLLFALSGSVLALRDPTQRPLHIAYGAVIVGHSIIVGGTAMWWAGHSFGARFMTDIVPFLVYFTSFNLQRHAGIRPQVQRALSGCIAVFALISIVINAQGAVRAAPLFWNVLPRNVDQDPSRVWEWSDPQFARTEARNNALHALAMSQVRLGCTIDFSSQGRSSTATVSGWGAQEPGFRWTVGREAALRIHLASDDRQLRRIRMRALAFAARGGSQRVEVSIDGKDAAALTVGSAWRDYHIDLAVPVSTGEHEIVLRLPEAHSPQSVGFNDDPRVLGIAVSSMSFVTANDDRNECN